MCQVRTTNYTICAHRRTTKQRCQKNLCRPKAKCEKLRSNETILGLCPKCPRRSTEPRSSPPLVCNEGRRTESVQLSGITLVEDSHIEVCESSARMKAVSGLRRMFGSVRSDRGRNNKADQREIESSQQGEAAMIAETETVKSVASSEQLAKEYRGVLACHPNTMLSGCGGARDVPAPKEVDPGTCTTWSTFLPRQDPLAEERAEKSVEAVASGVWNESETKDSREDEMLRVTRAIADSRRPDNTTSLDPLRKEELRKAEERLVRGRDGRGVM